MDDAALELTLATGRCALRIQGTTRTQIGDSGNSGDEDMQIGSWENEQEDVMNQIDDITKDLEGAISIRCHKLAGDFSSNIHRRVLKVKEQGGLMKKKSCQNQIKEIMEDLKPVISCHRAAGDLLSNAYRRALRLNEHVQSLRKIHAFLNQEAVMKNKMKEAMQFLKQSIRCHRDAGIGLSEAYRLALSLNNMLSSSGAGIGGDVGRGGQCSFSQPPVVTNHLVPS